MQIIVGLWEDRHGRNFIILGCVLFITQAVFGYFIKKLDGIVVQVVIYMIVLFSEIAWVEFEHNITIYKILILYCLCLDKWI